MEFLRIANYFIRILQRLCNFSQLKNVSVFPQKPYYHFSLILRQICYNLVLKNFRGQKVKNFTILSHARTAQLASIGQKRIRRLYGFLSIFKCGWKLKSTFRTHHRSFSWSRNVKQQRRSCIKLFMLFQCVHANIYKIENSDR